MALNARDEERAEALKNKFCAEDDAGMNTRFLNELRAMLSARLTRHLNRLLFSNILVDSSESNRKS